MSYGWFPCVIYQVLCRNWRSEDPKRFDWRSWTRTTCSLIYLLFPFPLITWESAIHLSDSQNNSLNPNMCLYHIYFIISLFYLTISYLEQYKRFIRGYEPKDLGLLLSHLLYICLGFYLESLGVVDLPSISWTRTVFPKSSAVVHTGHIYNTSDLLC